MPTTAQIMQNILTQTARDPGLIANNTASQIAGGIAGGAMMNNAIGAAIDALGVNKDGIITARDLERVSDHIRANPALYGEFVIGHGDDEGDEETGFHLVQGNDGSLQFQGRDFIDTVADAIYHIGFRYDEGRFKNEDGNANEQVADVAGWLNYFINGENRVYGTSKGETLHSGAYSGMLAAARDEIFDGRGGNDRIWADMGDDTVYGGSGHDQMGGGEGNDIIYAGTGDDKAYGDDGRDRIMGEDGDDQLGGQNGRDFLYGGLGDDRIYGGNGDDFAHGSVGRDVIGGGEGHDLLRGGQGHDKLHGDAGNDVIEGAEGNDMIYGGDHGDRLFGGAGDDDMHGSHGHDRMYGGSGRNVLYGGEGNDQVHGGELADMIHSSEGDDRLFGYGGNDKMFGGDGLDIMRAGSGRDVMRGHEGHDRMYGGAGADDIQGGAGHDKMYGGLGDDTMACSAGRDTFVGGKGADIMNAFESKQERDVFVFASGDTGVTKSTRDVVNGFGTGTDKIDLTGYDNLRWVSEGDFNATGRGEVSYLGKLVMIDEDGNGQIDALIEVSASGALTASDFIL